MCMVQPSKTLLPLAALLALVLPTPVIAPAGADAATGSGAAAKPRQTMQTGVVPLGGRTPKKARYQEYVSLGDSWSADVKLLDLNGLPDSTHAPIDCAQSQQNYPKLLAQAIQVKVHKDATCGSATTDDFYAPQTGLPVGGSNPAQFDRLSPRTDLVTIGIGGNDAGISSAALSCLSPLPVGLPLPPGTVPTLPGEGLPLLGKNLPLGNCKERLTAGGVDQLARNIRQSRPKLVKAIREVRKRSPKARILLVDYLAAVATKGCWPRVPMTDSDMRYLHASFQKLNAMVRQAARIGGVEFVDTYSATVGHDVCQGPFKRYAEVLGVSVNGLAVGIPAHPNPAGARAQFRAVLKQVRKR